ncbi:MAG: aspartate--ammonia ligase [Christensenellales bacterium]|jgi:aspartate--ammonia ligase
MYTPILDIRDTEIAIKLIKDNFERELAHRLHLTRVSAPMFLLPSTGLNDDLNGVERPVGFDMLDGGEWVEVVHSLAKWKRYALDRYAFLPGEGLYTDMNAIRRDEETDALHSIYVDQWDWEKIITREKRTQETLLEAAQDIYRVLLDVDWQVRKRYPQLPNPDLPDRLTVITAQELEDIYPDLTAKEREHAFLRGCGAAFIQGIGGPLRSGKPHDGRAPDYDDWTLNGDILLYNKLLDCSFEISSMGIRVDAPAMAQQLWAARQEERAELPFHRAVLEDTLPLTIGGGIGQSRLCMFLLQKRHIGEVQVSVWPEDKVKRWTNEGIVLL